MQNQTGSTQTSAPVIGGVSIDDIDYVVAVQKEDGSFRELLVVSKGGGVSVVPESAEIAAILATLRHKGVPVFDARQESLAPAPARKRLSP